MRIGFNPNKDKIIESTDFFHQVILPVYIANEEGYFKDSFTILQYCLNSLFKTSHGKTYFTIVNNGSCTKIEDYLNQLYEENKIHELIHTTNIGKLNAILKGLIGHQFPLITISDADVLFLNDWQNETYIIFERFPKTGAVSPTPSSKMLRHYTSNVLFEKGLSKHLCFTEVLNPEAMKAFARSVDNQELYNECHLKKYLTISKGNVKAVIGAGHFVTTYRGAIFENLKQRNSNYGLGGNSEDEILDKPVFDQGYWRLSTQDNYAFHMGNIKESWMKVQVDALKLNLEINNTLPILRKKIDAKFKIALQSFILAKLFSRKPIWKLFLKYKGLTKNEANKY
ncbi:glycosyltransferase family 2 protein [Flavobacterium frigoris]|uniref:Glycosyl transferase family 2 n=1 Tax=Flavobacterium frigoris (strain PS1) TaxID=1086011 RepID=H7FM78_FLAFP|nr:glycosyltransferase family 2 protein [Flavobacterium frigoris]EIA10416.1 hypothetical protein HJ01_00276 [Flavobacterium frigoris PS1]